MFITGNPNSSIGSYLGLYEVSCGDSTLRGVRRGFGFRVEGSAALVEQYLVKLASSNQLEEERYPPTQRIPKH